MDPTFPFRSVAPITRIRTPHQVDLSYLVERLLLPFIRQDDVSITCPDGCFYIILLHRYEILWRFPIAQTRISLIL